MQQQLALLNSDELVALYHKINAELRKHLLDGSPWSEQQERINTLTEISKELTKRKVEIDLPAIQNSKKMD
jgi:hypothetical protein